MNALLFLAGLVCLGQAPEKDKVQGEVFTSTKANFKVVYPKGWKKTSAPGQFQLILEQGQQQILLGGEETNIPAEAILDDILSSQRNFAKVKELRHDAIQIAAAAGTLVHLEMMREGMGQD